MRIHANDSNVFNPGGGSVSRIQTPQSRGGDSVDISGQGMAFAGKLHISNSIQAERPSSANSIICLIERTMSDVGKIAEEMRALSAAAEDENMSDEQRIGLQIQMTDLQARLYRKTYGMSVEIASNGSNANFNSNLPDAIDYDRKMTIKLLEREQARLTNTGAAESDGALLLEQRVALRVENGPESHGLKEAYFDERLGKLAVSDEWSIEPLDGGTVRITGYRARDLADSGKVVSDADRFARANLSLLDVGAARASTKKIEKQIAAIAKMNEELSVYADKSRNDADDSIAGMGRMRPAQDGFGENPLNAKNLDAADLRLTDIFSENGRLYQKFDSFLKDRLHKSLGLGGIWDDVRNLTYA